MTNTDIPTEQAVVMAALKLFSQKSVDETTTTEVLQLSGVCKEEFKKYFSSIEDIWEKLVDLVIISVNAGLKAERVKAITIEQFTKDSFKSFTNMFFNDLFINLVIKNEKRIRILFSDDKVIKPILDDIEKDFKELPFYFGLSDQDIKLKTVSMVTIAIDLMLRAHTGKLNLTKEQIEHFYSKLFIGCYNEILKETKFS